MDDLKQYVSTNEPVYRFDTPKFKVLATSETHWWPVVKIIFDPTQGRDRLGGEIFYTTLFREKTCFESQAQVKSMPYTELRQFRLAKKLVQEKNYKTLEVPPDTGPKDFLRRHGFWLRKESWSVVVGRTQVAIYLPCREIYEIYNHNRGIPRVLEIIDNIENYG